MNEWVVFFKNFNLVEDYNNFARSLVDKRFRTINIMDIVCLDDKMPCNDKTNGVSSNRVDGLHYD